MSLSSKDLITSGATAVALLGTIVYTQYKFNKLQTEINAVREECQTLARYVKLLEAKIASDLKGGNGHHVHAANPNPQTPPEPHRHHSGPPEASHPSRNHPPRKAAHPEPKPIPPKARKVDSDNEDSGEDTIDSPPPSNRRARTGPPPKNPAPKSTQPRPTKPTAPTPVMPKADSVRQPREPSPPVSVTAQRSKRRYLPKDGDDDEEGMVVSSGRNPGTKKSILKPPGAAVAKDKEEEDDPDLLGDIESVAKSTKRPDDDEGRKEAQGTVKARMERTRQIAAALQKSRESSAAASSPSPPD